MGPLSSTSARMEFPTSLTQEEVDLLLQIEHGSHEAIVVDVAWRFVVQGFLRALDDCEAIHSVTAAGRTLMAEVRDGLHDRHGRRPI